MPRNPDARDTLKQLTENAFLSGGWSLKETIIRVVTSEYFNRRAPDTSPLDSAYELPRVHKPFEVNDPRQPPEATAGWSPGDSVPSVNVAHRRAHLSNEEGRSRHFNGMPDAVHRYDAHNLFRSLHEALDWGDIPRFDLPSGRTYPDDAARKSIGQYYSPTEPGFNGVQFEMMVSWEVMHGACEGDDKDVAGGDWIDAVLAAAEAAGGLTRRDIATTARDWLLSNGTIATHTASGDAASEEALVNALFGGDASTAVLDDVIDFGDAAERDAVEGALRQYCGVMLQTPQFLLAGIADEDRGTQPALRVCNGTPCEYEELCDGLRTSFGIVHPFKRLVCGPPLRVVDRFPTLPPPDVLMCPELLCHPALGGVGPLGPECLLNPTECFPPVPPCFRRGCEEVDCCGGPLPPLESIDEGWRFVADLEGTEVVRASGVELYRFGEERPIQLKAGTRLAYRDWLVMPPGSHLAVETKVGLIQTPESGVPEDASARGWQIQVSGPSNRLFHEAKNALNSATNTVSRPVYGESPVRAGAEGVFANKNQIQRMLERLGDSEQHFGKDPRDAAQQ